ncbi:diaminopropionate ammonia-lyase [Candidatus Pelagibacter sp.]|nr:diaminopropionate ammonia-lyase [Candidatus Pelagibacter sp.]
MIISSATAGNHGRSVAWGAKRLGLKCKIFVSQYVSDSRINEIKKFGAEVIRVKGDYENSLNECKKFSKKNNWKIVQDVATRDYKLVPQLTMAGYSIMIREISKQTNQYITHIFLQAGVGGMAAGVVAGVAKYFKRIPKIIIVEPDRADCVLQSIKINRLKKIKIKKESIMGGMSCNEMSYIPWQILKKASNCCVSVSDRNVAKTVAMLKDKRLSKNSIIGGECSTPGIISLIGVCNDYKTKKLIELNEKSNVLVIGCEGNADVKLYTQLLSKGRK